MKRKNSADWRYLAIVLDERQKVRLKTFFGGVIPEGWKVYCDHLTVVYNDRSPKAAEFMESHKKDIGQPFSLLVNSLGFDGLSAMAVGCIGYESANRHPHITVACAEGIQPKESNNIRTWTPIEPFTLTGTLELS